MFLTSGAGSAGGPKPGRAGFYLELGRRHLRREQLIRSYKERATASAVALRVERYNVGYRIAA